MGSWGKWIAAGVIATAAALPFAYAPWKDAVKVEHRPNPRTATSSMFSYRCKEGGFPLPFRENIAFRENLETVFLTDEEREKFEQEVGASWKELFPSIHESPQGRYLAVEISQADAVRQARLVLIDREKGSLETLLTGAKEYDLSWQGEGKLFVYEKRNEDTTATFIDVATGMKTENPWWLLFNPYSFFALMVGTYAAAAWVKSKMEQTLPRTGGSLLERCIRDVNPNLEEFAMPAVSTALTTSMAYVVGDTSPKWAATLANTPLAFIPSMMALAGVFSQHRNIRKPQLLHFLPFFYHQCRSLFKREMVSEVDAHSSPQAKRVYAVSRACKKGDFEEAGANLDGIVRQEIAHPTIYGQLIRRPVEVIVNYLSSKKRPDELLTTALSKSCEPFPSVALQAWQRAAENLPAGIDQTEVKIARARYLVAVEKYLEGNPNTSEGQRIARRYSCHVSGVRDAVATHHHSLFAEAAAEVLQKSPREALSDSFNLVYGFQGRTLVPQMLIVKMGRDAARLQHEYLATGVLDAILPVGRVPTPLWYGVIDGTPVMLLQRAAGSSWSGRNDAVTARKVVDAVAEYGARGTAEMPRFLQNGIHLPEYRLNERCAEYLAKRCGWKGTEFVNDLEEQLERGYFCHADLHKNQIIIGDEVCILDPEWVSRGYVCRDLARLACIAPETRVDAETIGVDTMRKGRDEGTLRFTQLRAIESMYLARYFAGFGQGKEDVQSEQEQRNNAATSLRSIADAGWRAQECRELASLLGA